MVFEVDFGDQILALFGSYFWPFNKSHEKNQCHLFDQCNQGFNLKCFLSNSIVIWKTYPGDSGGPLIYYDQDADRNLQIGVVYGSLQECSDQNYPSIYARLDNYYILNFIRETAFGDTIDKPVEIDGKFLLIVPA